MPQNSTKIYTQVSLPDRILQDFHLWTRVLEEQTVESEEFSFFPTTVQVNLHPFSQHYKQASTLRKKDTYSTKLTNTENFKVHFISESNQSVKNLKLYQLRKRRSRSLWDDNPKDWDKTWWNQKIIFPIKYWNSWNNGPSLGWLREKWFPKSPLRLSLGLS